MQNGTRRFNEIEKYICNLPKTDQDFAVCYYHALLNVSKSNNMTVVDLDENEIAEIINEIMYRI